MLPLPASGSNDWANAGDAMPAAATVAMTASVENLVMVFLLIAEQTRTRRLVFRRPGDRLQSATIPSRFCEKLRKEDNICHEQIVRRALFADQRQAGYIAANSGPLR